MRGRVSSVQWSRNCPAKAARPPSTPACPSRPPGIIRGFVVCLRIARVMLTAAAYFCTAVVVSQQDNKLMSERKKERKNGNPTDLPRGIFCARLLSKRKAGEAEILIGSVGFSAFSCGGGEKRRGTLLPLPIPNERRRVIAAAKSFSFVN